MKIIFLSFGLLSFAIGMIGIVLPILPTTPFLLLTGYLLGKSNDRFHNWFLETKVYQKYLKDFSENKEMTKRNKWVLLLGVDVMMIISFITVDSFALKILIVVLEIGKYYYFATQIKTI